MNIKLFISTALCAFHLLSCGGNSGESSLSDDEFAAAQEQSGLSFFTSADVNGDGLLTKDEYVAPFLEYFDMYDTDDDGDFDASDIEPPSSLDSFPDIDGDTDNNQLLSREEFIVSLEESFEAIDTNGDSSLSLEELV